MGHGVYFNLHLPGCAATPTPQISLWALRACCQLSEPENPVRASARSCWTARHPAPLPLFLHSGTAAVRHSFCNWIVAFDLSFFMTRFSSLLFLTNLLTLLPQPWAAKTELAYNRVYKIFTDVESRILIPIPQPPAAESDVFFSEKVLR